jgi:thermostable 8-oxoguanine DNA glycosylase
MQQISIFGSEDVVIPPAHEELLPGIAWGRAEDVLTPAYWAVRSRCADAATHGFVCTEGTFADELAFCLLGGFGITAELATSYFVRLRNLGAFEPDSTFSEADYRQVLTEPIAMCGRQVRYRFPAQRARRLARAMPTAHAEDFAKLDALQLRRALLEFEGIGPKTASWIVRNWLGSDAVAILDVHVIRACQVFGLFPETVKLPSEYDRWEARFLEFSEAISIRASVLDAVLWSEMRTFSPTLVRRLR